MVVFVLSLSLTFGPSAGYAQVGTGFKPVPTVMAGLQLPQPGAMVTVSPVVVPAVIRGVKIFPDNPLRFDFIISTRAAMSLSK